MIYATLIDKINDQLKFRHHLPDGMVSQAIAAVVFNHNCNSLAANPEVTREMVAAAALVVRRIADEAYDQVKPPRDRRVLVARYYPTTGGVQVARREVYLYGSLGRGARRAVEIGRERGYVKRGCIRFQIQSFAEPEKPAGNV